MNTNKQIRFLAIEAGLISTEYNGFDQIELTGAQRKFAESIIRECAKLTLDFKNDEHYSGWLDYRDEIKKHFGMK